MFAVPATVMGSALAFVVAPEFSLTCMYFVLAGDCCVSPKVTILASVTLYRYLIQVPL